MVTQSLNPLNIDQLNQAIQNEVKAWYEQYQSKVALMESTIVKQQLAIQELKQANEELKNTIELLAPTQVDKQEKKSVKPVASMRKVVTIAKRKPMIHQ